MKKIEERIEELETMVYQSKNVLTFNEASKFIGISKSYLYKLTSAGRRVKPGLPFFNFFKVPKNRP